MELQTRRAGAGAMALAGLIVTGWVPAATLMLDISNLRSAQGRVAAPGLLGWSRDLDREIR